MPKIIRARRDRQLFGDKHLSDVMRGWSRRLDTAVQEVDARRLLESEPRAWAEHFESRFRREPPALHPESTFTSEPEDAGIDVSHDARFGRRLDGRPTIAPGTRVTFHVPFDGDGDLLRFRPSESFIGPMRARIGRGELTFSYLMTQGAKPEEVRGQFDRELGLILTVASNVARAVESWNSQLIATVRAQVERRREKLLADQALVDGFGFPVRRREGAATTFAVPTTRRRILPPERPDTAAAPPDPALEANVYNEILDVCRSMSLVMERSPGAFAGVGEEVLRTHFLVALNAVQGGSHRGDLQLHRQDRHPHPPRRPQHLHRRVQGLEGGRLAPQGHRPGTWLPRMARH